jgi:transposase-like protein
LPKQSKLTKEQKVQIAIDLLAGKLSNAEICRKYGISTTYMYKIRDRALEILRANIDKTPGQPNEEVRALRKKVTDLEQLAGDQALVIRSLKKTQNHE